MTTKFLDLPYYFEESVAKIYALYFCDDIFKEQLLVRDSNFTVRDKYNNTWYYIYDRNETIIIDIDTESVDKTDELIKHIKNKIINTKPKSYKIYERDSFFSLDDEEEKIVLYEWDASKNINKSLYDLENQDNILEIMEKIDNEIDNEIEMQTKLSTTSSSMEEQKDTLDNNAGKPINTNCKIDVDDDVESCCFDSCCLDEYIQTIKSFFSDLWKELFES